VEFTSVATLCGASMWGVGVNASCISRKHSAWMFVLCWWWRRHWCVWWTFRSWRWLLVEASLVGMPGHFDTRP
jgi:hypothetical protein